MNDPHVERVEAWIRRYFADPQIRLLDVDSGMTAVPLVQATVLKSTHSFSANQTLFVYCVHWGMNERAMVVGRFRGKHRFVRGVCPIASLGNFRPKLVQHPAVLGALAGRYVDGGIFIRFLALPGEHRSFREYQAEVLARAAP
jgi:hypothetical protein